MDRSTVFTKTAKGITQVNQKSASLSKDLMKVLKLIDGKSNFGQIMEKAELDKMQLEKALNTLAKDGFARVFQTRQEESDPFAEDDFDFTAPGKIATPASTQRVVPGAANDISELVRQQANADKDKKAREQAHEAARAKAKVEAESRAKLEAEAKARQQAEQQAMEQARRAKEASERARVELESKMREEEARRASLAQQQARFTAEQKAKEEEESRRLAELRVKAEREAKALAEARARAEAEAAAMAKARAEAEAAAQRQAAQATNAEAQMKARLKEEIEARIRGEMEHLLRNELEEKTRDEMKAQILAEARMAAKAELEERLQEEREGIARAEAEARSKAEKDASARADQEAKKRAEAEARAAAETEARMKAEDEARRLRAQAEEQTRRAKEMEARARADAEARAIEQAENAKRLEAEERDKRERELSATIEAERRAKEEAEKRAKIEARARETIAEDTRAKVQAEIEGDMEKRAEIEGKAQAKAYMAAKEKAEQDEEERIRADQARKAREIAEVLRTRVEPDEVAPETSKGAKRRPRRSGSLLRTALVVLVLLLLAGLAALHVVPLRPYTAKVERAMSAWLNDQVSISTMTFQLVPTPHLKVQNMAVGKLLDATASEGRIYLDITSLLGDKLAINAIELDNVTLSNEAVRRIPLWGKTEGKPAAGAIDRITLRNVKMEVKPALEPFAATLNFGRDGVLRQANLAAGTWSVALKPSADGFDFDATANNLTLPAGAPIVVSSGRFKGTWQGNEIVVPEFEADVLEGKVNGALRVSWGTGVRLQSEFTMAKVNVQQLVAAFTKAIVVTGRAEGSFNVVAEGPSIEQIFAAPRIQGKFRVGDGTISNVDLVAVMQSDTAGQRAGVTKFVELGGELHAADTRLSYQKVNLQGGVLRGNGTVDLGANGNLAGRISLEIRSQVAQDRGSFVVSGNVQRPSIRRGG